MPQKLRVDRIDTVGFVDDGANQLADILIWKRAADKEGDMSDTEGGTGGGFTGLLRAVGKALKWSDDDVEAAVIEAATIQQEVGKMSDGFDLATLPDEAQQVYRVLEERVTAAETARVEAEEALAKATAEPAGEEDVLKGASDAVLKRMEELEKRTAEAEEVAKAERDARRTAEFSKMAETDLAHLPGDNKVDVLKAVHDLPETERKAVLEMLRSADAVSAESDLFKSIGSEGVGDESKALDRISLKARELVEKSDHPTFEQAFDHVMRTDRELAKAYREERTTRR